VYRFGSNVNLVKSYEEEWDDVQDLLLDQYASGTTNLLPALKQVEERSDLADKESMLISVTDGCPSYEEDCKQKIRDLAMPTMSMQIKQDTEAFDGVYDSLVNVSSADEVTGAMRRLVRRTVFK
jgi:hypothetical protein